MQTVFVLTRGDSDSTSIVAVFATREEANRFCVERNYDADGIEEYPVGSEHYTKSYSFSVRPGMDPVVRYAGENFLQFCRIGSQYGLRLLLPKSFVHNTLSGYLNADSLAEAAQAALQLLAEVIESGQWTEDEIRDPGPYGISYSREIKLREKG